VTVRTRSFNRAAFLLSITFLPSVLPSVLRVDDDIIMSRGNR
jgi:hypothetical protein